MRLDCGLLWLDGDGDVGGGLRGCDGFFFFDGNFFHDHGDSFPNFEDVSVTDGGGFGDPVSVDEGAVGGI